LRLARAAAGLSLAQVGGHDLTRQAVHLIETGKVRPTMRSLRVLAQRLDVTVASLLVPGDGEVPLDENGIAELDALCRRQEYDRVVVRAREVLEYCRVPGLVACAHYYMGQALCYMVRPRAALDHLSQARELFESLDDDHGRVAETMELQALALHIAEDPGALDLAREALDRYRMLDGRRPEVESRLLQRIGTILADLTEFEAARSHYEEALQVAGGVRDLVRLARLYHGIGICQIRIGTMRQGTELLVKAHTLYQAEERLAGASWRSDLARVENDIGQAFVSMGDHARAEEYLASALSRFESSGHERMRCRTLLSLGELRQVQGRLDESIDYVRRGIDLAERSSEMQSVAKGCQVLGELQAVQGERDMAEESFQRALDILREMGRERRYVECLQARDRALGSGARATGTGA
jgi:tetratricopeptide (TPR) repeat protein